MLFLPPLIYNTAFLTAPRETRENAVPITALAFAAAVAPTDAVAATLQHGLERLVVVVAGVYLGTRVRRHAAARVPGQRRAVRRTLVFILESGLFALLGLELRTVAGDLSDSHSVAWLAGAAAAVVAVVVGIRLAWEVSVAPLIRYIPGRHAGQNRRRFDRDPGNPPLHRAHPRPERPPPGSVERAPGRVSRFRSGGSAGVRPGTVLTPPQVRVAARWMSGSRAASMEIQVTGIAGHRSSAEESPMYALNANAPSSQPALVRLLVRPREYRRPRLWVRVRVACGVFNVVFNVVLGVLLLASVRWLGPLAWLAALPLAGAALIFWTAYRLRASVHR